MTCLKVPLCIADIGEEELQAMREAALSGWLTEGPKNRELEDLFARTLGVPYAVSCNSGTSALVLALLGLGIRGEVIVPSFTFVASVNAIVVAGATPVFADVRRDTCNVDPTQIEALVTPRTEAIIAVHIAGHPARLDQLVRIADKYSLALIEDSAEAIGAKFRDRFAGSFGTGCFSFYPSKNMTTGEGGMVTTRDRGLAERVRSIAAHGIQPVPEDRFWYRSSDFPGYNFRLSNILAAIGVVQIKKLHPMNEKRRAHARFFSRELSRLGIEVPTEESDCQHVFQMYMIKVGPDNRDRLVRGLRHRGIGASVHFDPPAHRQHYYRQRYAGVSLPETEQLSASVLTLPMFPGMTAEQQSQVVEAVRDEVLVSRQWPVASGPD